MTTCTAQIIAHSQHFQTGTRVITAVTNAPRIIHAEFLTHGMIAKNASSSRAIPVGSVVGQLEENMFVPEYWGKNQSGMAARSVLDTEAEEMAREIWINAGRNAIESTKALQSLGLHKQLTNRITESFQYIKVCLSATELKNFMHLRNHDDAQPEIKDLAQALDEAIQQSTPKVLEVGEWHLPFYQDGYWSNVPGLLTDIHGHTLEEARMISTSCAAQTSYRKNDDTIEKAKRLYEMFFNTTHIHASPAEHQATPMNYAKVDDGFSINPFTYAFSGENEGATHIDKYGDIWSGKFKHWIQHRQLIDNHYIRG